VVRAGEEHQVSGVTVRILEVTSYRTFSGRRELMVAYQIIDGDYISPIAHFYMAEREDVRRKIEEVVNYYLQVKSALTPRR